MSAAPGERFEVEDLDADNVLAFLRDLDEEARRIEAFKLRAAAHWADLHPATADTGAATPDGGVLDADELLGGEGTPAVAAFTPEDLAVVLQISPSAAAGLVADALDLRHRLPHLWRTVMRLQVPAWLARRVAQQTRRLPKAGAKYVDETLAARTHWGTGIVDRVVADAIARFDPAEHARREDRGKASWDVKLTHPGPTEFAGTSELWARGDSIALQAFHDLVCAEAHPPRPASATPTTYQARKAKALGIIAARHGHLDLTNAPGASSGSPLTRTPIRTLGLPRRPLVATTLYLHLSLADLATHLTAGATGTPVVGGGRAPRPRHHRP